MTRLSIHPTRLSDDKLLSECTVRRQRRSGPGGQHRNKVETGIFVEHLPTGTRSEATEGRSQARNHELALQRLRTQLSLSVRSTAPISEFPSQLWRARCGQGRLIISDRHHDFATLLAEALDVLAAVGWDAKSAAQHLGCSTTQFVRFLKRCPDALQQLNNHRKQTGLRKLR